MIGREQVRMHLLSLVLVGGRRGARGAGGETGGRAWDGGGGSEVSPAGSVTPRV